MNWREIDTEARRITIDAIQAYETYLGLRDRSALLAGGMVWRKINGHEYLIRVLDGIWARSLARSTLA